MHLVRRGLARAPAARALPLRSDGTFPTREAAVGRVMKRPFTRVPVRLPRSTTSNPSPHRRMTACSRARSLSSSVTEQSIAPPIVTSSASNSTSWRENRKRNFIRG
jgi:hypothetical protein